MLLTKMQCRRAVLMTMSLFFLCVMLVLNVMVNQLQSTNTLTQSHLEEIQEPEKEFKIYIAKGRRNPMAANEKSFSDSDSELGNADTESDKIKYEEISMFDKHHSNRRKNLVIDLQGLNPVFNQNDNKNDEDDYYNDDYDDINKVVIEDNVEEEEDDSDDDDYDETTVKLMQQKLDENHNTLNSMLEAKDLNVKQVFTKPHLQYKDVSNNRAPARSIKSGHTKRVVTREGIYWSSSIEDLVPKGKSTLETLEYMKHVRKQNVIKLDPPAWNRCGRPKNGFATLQDGSFMCARYRDPHNKMVLGEVLSFYLSRLLGMDNVPAVVLSRTNKTSSQWRKTNFHTLDWKDGRIVALIEWIPNMETYSSLVKIPNIILQAYEDKTVINHKVLESSNLTSAELSELVQWGSMIVYDYLTGNYDRIASMQDAAYKEKKPSILLENIRNLRKSTSTKKLWLIDNESGLLDAYDLMYNNIFGGDKFIKFHRDMLQTFCVFQKSMVDSLLKLNNSPSPHMVLERYAQRHDNLLSQLPRDQVYGHFKSHFRDRVKEVSDWVKICTSKLNR